MFYAAAWPILTPIARRKVLRVTGLENVPKTGPYILASNHIGWLDPLYLLAALGRERGFRLHFISSTRKHAWAHTLTIDPKSPGDVLKPALAVLRHGGAVGVFAEGFSNGEPTLPRGKTGAARLALTTGASVIPAGIVGAFRPGWVPSLGDLLLPGPRRHYTIAFGAPIVVPIQNNPAKDSVHALTAQIMSAIGLLSGKLYG
jgi:1-acyl-sn-glycerol-3-phosphate acyltransferase